MYSFLSKTHTPPTPSNQLGRGLGRAGPDLAAGRRLPSAQEVSGAQVARWGEAAGLGGGVQDRAIRT